MTKVMGHVEHFAANTAMRVRGYTDRVVQGIAKNPDPESAVRWMGDARAVFWFLPCLILFTLIIADQTGNSTNAMWLCYIAFPFLFWNALVETARRYEKDGVSFVRGMGDAGLAFAPIAYHILVAKMGWVGAWETSTDIAFFYVADFISAMGCLMFLRLAFATLFPKKEPETKNPPAS